jgi:hypothetical protein
VERVCCRIAIRSHTQTLFNDSTVSIHRKDEKVRSPDTPLYVLGDFSLTSIGTRTNQVLRAKAAESGTLLSFAVCLANRFENQVEGGHALLIAGRALERYMTITRSSGFHLSIADRQGLVDAAIRFLCVREAAGIHYKPKMHLMLHLVVSAGRFGNPRCLGTWVDEGLNMRLAAVCRSSYASVWSRRVLATFAHPAGPLGPSSSEKLRRGNP